MSFIELYHQIMMFDDVKMLFPIYGEMQKAYKALYITYDEFSLLRSKLLSKISVNKECISYE